MTLLQQLQNRGIKFLPMAHVVTWHGRPGRVTLRPTGYHSNNQFVIDKQLDLMVSEGYAGVIALTYGSADPYMNDACEKLVFQCWQKKMLFMLCVDPWAVGDKTKIAALSPVDAQTARNAGWQAAMSYLAPFFSCPSYVPEKYVLDFATGQNLANPLVLKAYLDFAWPKYTSTPAKDLTDQNAKATIPAIFRKFNDSGFPGPPVDYNRSVWGDKPARIMDSAGGNLFFDILDGLAAKNPGAKYVQDVTWNDRNEDTSVEEMYAMQHGVRLSD